MPLSVIKHSKDLIDVLHAAMLALDIFQPRHLAFILRLLVLHQAQTQLSQLFLAVKLDQTSSSFFLRFLGTLLHLIEVGLSVIVSTLLKVPQFGAL